MFSSRHSVTRQGVVPRGVLRACRASGGISTRAHGRGALLNLLFSGCSFKSLTAPRQSPAAPRGGPGGSSIPSAQPGAELTSPRTLPEGARNSHPPEQHRDAIAHQWELIPLIKHSLMWLPLCRLPLEHLLSPPRAVPRLNLLRAQVESETQEWVQGTPRPPPRLLHFSGNFQKKGVNEIFQQH